MYHKLTYFVWQQITWYTEK